MKADKLAETNPMLMVSDWDENFCKVEKAKTITGPEDSSTSSNSNYSTKTDSISSLEKSEDVSPDETPTPSPRNSLSSLLSLDVSVLIYKTCSCRPVRYFGTLFLDDITKFWDENLLLFTFLIGKLRKNLLWTNT